MEPWIGLATSACFAELTGAHSECPLMTSGSEPHISPFATTPTHSWWKSPRRDRSRGFGPRQFWRVAVFSRVTAAQVVRRVLGLFAFVAVKVEHGECVSAFGVAPAKYETEDVKSMRSTRAFAITAFFAGFASQAATAQQAVNILDPFQWFNWAAAHAIDNRYPHGRDRVTVNRVRRGNDEEITWRIDSPSVTQRETIYNNIDFRSGDRISIQAGGCVQTGGHGDTWKSYVHPVGDESRLRYSGLLWIPGVTGGSLSPIVGMLLPKTFVVPEVPNVSASSIKLHLGYQDDNYDDNGYYSHDNGNDDQCRNVGDARVQITVRRAAGSPASGGYSPHTAPFDLVWKDVDANLVPLNPIWANQIDHPQLRPALGSGCATTAGPLRFAQFFDLPCTSQKPSFDLAEQVFGFLGVCNGDVLNGHANWMIATFEGSIKWEDHENPTFGDDDYNFGLYREDNAALTLGGEGLGLEWEARETIDHFTSGWWTQFRDAVDGKNGINPASMVNGHYAIVTGLFGVDGVHGGWSESHPVFSIAIRLARTRAADGRTEERWAFFLRNWGNEGQCSHDQHYWDAANGRDYFVQLPWLKGAQSVDVAFEKTTIKSSFTPTTPVAFEQDPGQWFYLRTALPPGESEPRVHGEIVLRWSNAPANAETSHLSEIAHALVAYPKRAHAPEGEGAQPRLDRLLDASQKAAVTSILTRPSPESPVGATPDKQLGTLLPAIAPHAHPTVDPRLITPPKDKHREDPERRAEMDKLRQQLERQFGPALNQLRLRPE